MEILDPDLWNDDGTPKRPSKEYMDSLRAAQDLEALDPETPVKREQEKAEAYLNYARLKRETKAQRTPEIGDIVHYWFEKDSVCRAALVMEVESFNHNCELRVHIPRELYADCYAVHDEHKEVAGEGTWHWPCGEGQ